MMDILTAVVFETKVVRCLMFGKLACDGNRQVVDLTWSPWIEAEIRMDVDDVVCSNAIL